MFSLVFLPFIYAHNITLYNHVKHISQFIFIFLLCAAKKGGVP